MTFVLCCAVLCCSYGCPVVLRTRFSFALRCVLSLPQGSHQSGNSGKNLEVFPAREIREKREGLASTRENFEFVSCTSLLICHTLSHDVEKNFLPYKYFISNVVSYSPKVEKYQGFHQSGDSGKNLTTFSSQGYLEKQGVWPQNFGEIFLGKFWV